MLNALLFHLLLTGYLAATEIGPSPRPNVSSSELRVEEGFVGGADGVRLFYRKIGNGRQKVIYLHGGPGSNFRGNGEHMDALVTGRTMIMYDQRGSGRSTMVTDSRLLDAEDHVRDLEAVRRRFGFERVSLIGLSWGAGLATLYADKHPLRVARLLLISPMSPTRTFAEERTARLNDLLGPTAVARRNAIRERLAGADDRETVAICREANDIVFRLYLIDATSKKLREVSRRCNIPPAAIRNRPVVEAATMASLGDWDFRPVLARLRVPVLVMEGAQTNVPLDATRAWTEAIPDARLLLVANAGHEFFLDQPETFAAAANEFLDGWKSKTGPVSAPRD